MLGFIRPIARQDKIKSLRKLGLGEYRPANATIVGIVVTEMCQYIVWFVFIVEY